MGKISFKEAELVREVFTKSEKIVKFFDLLLLFFSIVYLKPYRWLLLLLNLGTFRRNLALCFHMYFIRFEHITFLCGFTYLNVRTNWIDAHGSSKSFIYLLVILWFCELSKKSKYSVYSQIFENYIWMLLYLRFNMISVHLHSLSLGLQYLDLFLFCNLTDALVPFKNNGQRRCMYFTYLHK